MGFNDELRNRTKKFSLRVIKLFQALRTDETSKNIGRQLLRAGMSVGANTRAATRARSKKEFISKLGIVVEEADECCFWMELLTEAGLIDNKRIAGLYQEAIEITKIMAVSRKNSRDGGS